MARIFAVLPVLTFCLFGQSGAAPDLQSKRWPAHWITHPSIGGAEFAAVLFRRTLELESAPETFRVHVSADNRYRLFVNGRYVGEGPPTDDLRHWRYDTYDLAPFLRNGRNVIAALVWQGGYTRPMAQISHRLAFLLQGVGLKEQDANTNGKWKTWWDRSWAATEYEQVDRRFLWRYYVAGPGEIFSAASHPWGWQEADFEDSTWQAPRLLPVAAPKGVEGHTPYELMPAATPPLRCTWREAERQAWPLTIPPHTKRTVLLDFGLLTFGWIHAAWTGGRGSRMTLRYTEALRLKDEPTKKGHRNQTEGKIALGPWDEIHPDGAARKMKMLHPRAARFIELTVETAGEPLNVDGLRIEETTFPASLRAAFEADDPVLERIFAAGWRTLELGAQDTFVSDLGWERMQYIGDTMVQAMAWLAATGDDRLVRLAIEQFDASRLPEGLTQSRYPANLVQLTPIYSLAWIHMVCDYHLYRGDRQFLEARLPGISPCSSGFSATRTRKDCWVRCRAWTSSIMLTAHDTVRFSPRSVNR